MRQTNGGPGVIAQKTWFFIQIIGSVGYRCGVGRDHFIFVQVAMKQVVDAKSYEEPLELSRLGISLPTMFCLSLGGLGT